MGAHSAPCALPELRRRKSERMTEHRREVAVTREAKVERERREIIGMGKLDQRTREAQAYQVLM